MKLTKKEGQPSLFEQNDETKIYFSYDNNQITLIKENNGSTDKYTYENKIPSEISYTPPTGAVDGNGATRFINEGDSIIRIESWGEPSSLLYRKEIELDKDKNPVKITEIGAFALGLDGRTKEIEGEKYTYVDMLFCTTWKITDEKIQIRRGVFYRKIDYIELYRVVDYAESQTLLQIIFKNKTVTVESGDKSHPVFSFYGIGKSEQVIEFLRPRVEIQKRKIGVYEVTNR